MTRMSIGIIGFGQFGQFMAKHLAPHHEVVAANRSDQSAAAEALGVAYGTHEEAASREVVIVGTPVQNMAETLERIAPHLRPGALVVDVASVKVRPVEMMRACLPSHVDLLATHPMFGPQSGRHGIRGLKCVLCPVRLAEARYARIRHFLGTVLELQLLEMTPERHDREIAYIQGLTHWISRAVRAMRLPDMAMSTPAYNRFLEIGELLRDDSLALFLTIERENPYTHEVRADFMEKLRELDSLIQDHLTS